MDASAARNFVNSLFSEKSEQLLSDTECAVFEGAWNGFSYKQIAENQGYSVEYLSKDVGFHLWQKISKVIERKIGKKNFKSVLETKARELQTLAEDDLPNEQMLTNILRILEKIDLSSEVNLSSTNLFNVPPALDNWQGRTEEFNKLRDILENGQEKTLGIVGLSGLGKSWLAAYIYESMTSKPKFWADVSLGTDFKVLADSILDRIGKKLEQKPSNLQETEQIIFTLLDALKHNPCLIVIDNLETLLDSSRQFKGSYKDFFRHWVERGTGSKIIITTQVVPEIMDGHGYWLPLQGLNRFEGGKLLENLEIIGEPKELEEFAGYLNGHPKMLRLVAAKLRAGTHIRKVEILGFRKLDRLLNEIPMPYRDHERIRFAWILEQIYNEMTLLLQKIFLELSIFRNEFDLETALGISMVSDFSDTSDEWQIQQLIDELTYRSLIESKSRSLIESKISEEKYYFHPFVLHYARQKVLEVCENRLQTLQKTQNILEEAIVLGKMSCIYYVMSHTEKSLQFADESQAIAKKLENLSIMAGCLIDLGNAHNLSGDYSRAYLLHWQGLQVAYKAKDPKFVAIGWFNIGQDLREVGRNEEAIEAYLKAREFYEFIGAHYEIREIDHLICRAIPVW